MTPLSPPALFVADSVGLDFLNSIAVPVDEPVEWLGSGEALLSWLAQAGLLPADVPDTLRQIALPGELDAVAGQARSLREWFRAFVQRHKGRPLGPGALSQLEPLNRLLARDEEFGQIVARPARRGGGGERPASGLAWCATRRWRSADSLLAPIAKALADLVCNDDFTYVKACQGGGCTLLFLDRTRGRARRWCSMAVCGNRAKQAAHRGRARQIR
jgi:predicted RNA-binding Zn ribbon-like protein